MATIKQKERLRAITGARALAKQLGTLPASKLWLDYDAEADVLYINLKRPQKATETIELEDEGILLRYRGNDLVGITVLDASQQQ